MQPRPTWLTFSLGSQLLSRWDRDRLAEGKRLVFKNSEASLLTNQDKEVGEIDIPRDGNCLIQRQRTPETKPKEESQPGAQTP